MTGFIEGLFWGLFILLPVWLLGMLVLAGLLSVLSDWFKKIRGKAD